MKKLVVFAGPPCSGKSTLGRLLGWSHLEMDQARARILPRSAHTREDRSAAYRAVAWTAEHLLRYSNIVICNGGYGREENRRQCEEVAQSAGASLYLVEFHVPAELAVQRNRERIGTHPGLDLTDDRVRQLVIAYPWSGSGLSIDSQAPIVECVNSIRNYINGPPVMSLCNDTVSVD